MKPVYKGRKYYYKKDGNNTREDYHYIRNQPLGYGRVNLTSVENFQTIARHRPLYVKPKPREYPGVL